MQDGASPRRAATPDLGVVTLMDVGGREVCGLDPDGGVKCVTFP
jgi:hypothetical protein